MRCTNPVRVASRRQLSICLVAVSASFAALEVRDASAQPAPPPAPAPAPEKRTRPEVVLAPQVPYPDGGTGDAAVILVLLIDAAGAVASAEVERGDEPFASAAREGAKRFVFKPATRDGVPAAAKIRYEVAFIEEKIVTQPEELAEEPPPETPSSPDDPYAPPPKPKPPAAIDITVEGVKHAPSVTSLTRSEVRQLPGAFGDPFRAIEILPGVTPIVSGLPFFYVRGAPPGNVGYFLDGVRVPYLFHAAAGPSVVHPGIVERVDLYAGGYPARYGRYAGAIVSAEATEPRTDLHGEAVVRLVDAGALVESGFADGKGTALAGARYSYTGALFSLVSPEITLDYRDYQARVTYDVAPDQRVSLFAFGAYDYLSSTELDIETVLFGSEFYRVDGRYDVFFRGGGKMRAAATWGFDQTRVADGRNTRDMMVGTRLTIEKPLTETLEVRSGFDVQHDMYGADARTYADPDDPATQRYNTLFPPRIDGSVGVWTDFVWQIDPRMEIVPGLRTDFYFSNGAKAVGVDPRLSMTYHVTDDVRIRPALGVAHQPPSFIVPIPGLAVANLDGGLQQSLQTAATLEVDLPWSTLGKITGFNNVFIDMSDTLGAAPDNRDPTRIPRSLGGARGIELFVSRSLGNRVGGILSYTFSRTTRTVGGLTFPAAFDRTHVFHSALGYDLGRGWRAGTRFSLYTGPPILEAPNGSDAIQLLNISRDPAFYRIDFRVEKKWRLTETGWISFVAEMLNTTLNTETIGGNEVGPVTIPSIGVEAGL
jgi:hypothetical protein